MRLTDYTDYALRLLMYLGARPGRMITVREIATEHGISHNHLTKIVHQLGVHGELDTQRGRCGGVRLARPPEQIMLGAIIRITEPDFQMVDCLSETASRCVLAGRCKLKCLLTEATLAFLERLDRVPLSALLDGAAPVALTSPLTFHPVLQR